VIYRKRPLVAGYEPHRKRADVEIIIDYPFDEPGHTTRDDQGKLQMYSQSNPAGTRTLVLASSVLRVRGNARLEAVVIIEHVLTGERFSNTPHSFPADRSTAKTLLENQRTSLRERVKQHIEAAYGIRGSQSKSIDNSHDLTDTFRSLYPG